METDNILDLSFYFYITSLKNTKNILILSYKIFLLFPDIDFRRTEYDSKIITRSYLPFLAIINGSPNEEEWGEKDLKLCITSVYKYF